MFNLKVLLELLEDMMKKGAVVAEILIWKLALLPSSTKSLRRRTLSRKIRYISLHVPDFQLIAVVFRKVAVNKGKVF